jgi:membrane protein YqaA with SNARE-associated domain
MSKHLHTSFLNQWLSIQVFGSIALAVATQAIVTLITLLLQLDNLAAIFALRLLGCLVSSTIQGYLQWQILKQVIKSLDRQWIYTAIAGLPINILSWGLIHLGIKTLVLDRDGTVLIILAIVGAVVGGINGHIIGNWQKSLFKQRLYWRSLWHDWDREQLLAGALSGVVTSVMIISAVFLFGWDWIASPLSAFICSIGLASISQVMYGLIVGDTIQDVFKQAKLIE